MTTIVLTSAFPVINLAFMGYNYNLTTGVFLSSYDTSIFPFVNSVNNYTNITRVSSICPPFTGYPIDSFNVIDSNRINITIDGSTLNVNDITTLKLMDVVITGVAGYTKLSDKSYILEIGSIPGNNNYLRMENGGILLLESGSKLLLEQ
jgi:hypothetical protein